MGHQRVAVGVRARDRRSADRAAAAATVLDDQRLSELPAERLEHDAGDNVDRAAGRKRDDHADRLGGPALRPTHGRQRGRYGGSADQLQMAAASKFQGRSSSLGALLTYKDNKLENRGTRRLQVVPDDASLILACCDKSATAEAMVLV